MNNLTKAYIAIDLHRRHSVIGYTNNDGQLMHIQQVNTKIRNLINQVSAIAADQKYLTIEQTDMTFAIAEKLAPYVDRLIVCEPRHNKLISQNATKNDRADTLHLCKLLRLGELKPVWRPKQMGRRRLFFQQAKEYHRLNKLITARKNQLQASLRHWGMYKDVKASDYRDPKRLLEAVDSSALADQLAADMRLIQDLQAHKAEQKARFIKTASNYQEISEFQKMSGIGPVGAHTYSAYIQTPHRFPGRSQLIRFCQLGVSRRSSDGKQLGREHLDKARHSCLKQVSYIAWETSQHNENEVSRFYQASLKRSNNATNARLNTQRKILTTLWIIWKHNRTYRPARFCSGCGNSAR